MASCEAIFNFYYLVNWQDHYIQNFANFIFIMIS